MDDSYKYATPGTQKKSLQLFMKNKTPTETPAVIRHGRMASTKNYMKSVNEAKISSQHGERKNSETKMLDDPNINDQTYANNTPFDISEDLNSSNIASPKSNIRYNIRSKRSKLVIQSANTSPLNLHSTTQNETYSNSLLGTISEDDEFDKIKNKIKQLHNRKRKFNKDIFLDANNIAISSSSALAESSDEDDLEIEKGKIKQLHNRKRKFNKEVNFDANNIDISSAPSLAESSEEDDLGREKSKIKRLRKGLRSDFKNIENNKSDLNTLDSVKHVTPLKKFNARQANSRVRQAQKERNSPPEENLDKIDFNMNSVDESYQSSLLANAPELSDDDEREKAKTKIMNLQKKNFKTVAETNKSYLPNFPETKENSDLASEVSSASEPDTGKQQVERKSVQINIDSIINFLEYHDSGNQYVEENNLSSKNIIGTGSSSKDMREDNGDFETDMTNDINQSGIKPSHFHHTESSEYNLLEPSNQNTSLKDYSNDLSENFSSSNSLISNDSNDEIFGKKLVYKRKQVELNLNSVIQQFKETDENNKFNKGNNISSLTHSPTKLAESGSNVSSNYMNNAKDPTHTIEMSSPRRSSRIFASSTSHIQNKSNINSITNESAVNIALPSPVVLSDPTEHTQSSKSKLENTLLKVKSSSSSKLSPTVPSSTGSINSLQRNSIMPNITNRSGSNSSSNYVNNAKDSFQETSSPRRSSRNLASKPHSMENESNDQSEISSNFHPTEPSEYNLPSNHNTPLKDYTNDLSENLSSSNSLISNDSNNELVGKNFIFKQKQVEINLNSVIQQFQDADENDKFSEGNNSNSSTLSPTKIAQSGSISNVNNNFINSTRDPSPIIEKSSSRRSSQILASSINHTQNESNISRVTKHTKSFKNASEKSPKTAKSNDPLKLVSSSNPLTDSINITNKSLLMNSKGSSLQQNFDPETTLQSSISLINNGLDSPNKNLSSASSSDAEHHLKGGQNELVEKINRTSSSVSKVKDKTYYSNLSSINPGLSPSIRSTNTINLNTNGETNISNNIENHGHFDNFDSPLLTSTKNNLYDLSISENETRLVENNDASIVNTSLGKNVQNKPFHNENSDKYKDSREISSDFQKNSEITSKLINESRNDLNQIPTDLITSNVVTFTSTSNKDAPNNSNVFKSSGIASFMQPINNSRGGAQALPLQSSHKLTPQAHVTVADPPDKTASSSAINEKGKDSLKQLTMKEFLNRLSKRTLPPTPVKDNPLANLISSYASKSVEKSNNSIGKRSNYQRKKKDKIVNKSISQAINKKIFQHFSRHVVSKDSMDCVQQVSEKFFEQFSSVMPIILNKAIRISHTATSKRLSKFRKEKVIAPKHIFKLVKELKLVKSIPEFHSMMQELLPSNEWLKVIPIMLPYGEVNPKEDCSGNTAS